ncbi:MAG: 16S rRNA (guanine(966)-N(2))-methyltransferase RsmD [Burkholderiales bacterium]|jgi:16S rRNA (guanine(966)-N(2))-methyltransferase RsmD|nr:16S rRNA (guanine(966)-N(2))-methyltransferase RsmD [Burkholderiales bacterium]
MSSRLSMAKVQAALRKGVAPAAAPVRSAASAAAPVRAQGAQGAGEIRIIGGQWKRTRLPVPQRPGLRPTPDRVRETLFNWLGQDMTGWRCLDAFAGTGALGLEAASRGAASVLLVEQDADLLARLQQHVQRLQAASVQLRRGDGVAALRQCAAASLDLVLLDPPFDSALFLPALQAAARAVGPQGWVYLEAPQAWDEAALAPLGLALHRHLRAGAVHAHLLQQIP